MRNEAVVAYRHELTNKCVRLDSTTTPNRHVTLYLDEWPYERAVTDRATAEIDGLHDTDTFAEAHIDDTYSVVLRCIQSCLLNKRLFAYPEPTLPRCEPQVDFFAAFN